MRLALATYARGTDINGVICALHATGRPRSRNTVHFNR
jgi:hypothetical protein